MWFSSKRKQMAELIDRHHDSIYRHALWLTGDADAASDLTQDTYFEAWKTFRRCHRPQYALAWLLAILRRQAAKLWRTREAGLEIHDVSMDNLATAPASDLDGVLDLMRALQRLPMTQREPILLYGLHGFTYEEIARQLDLPLGTVMSRLARGRQALNKIMQGQPGPNNVVSLFDAGYRTKRVLP